MPSSMLSSSPSILPAVSVSATTMGSVGSGAGVPPLPPPRAKGRKREQRSTDWEVLEGLKEGQTYDRVPKKFEGFVLKKRKWPVKGYHKVRFNGFAFGFIRSQPFPLFRFRTKWNEAFSKGM